MHFHWIDYLIIGIIGLSMLTGLFRGFVKELVALMVWVITVWVGCNYSQLLAKYYEPYLHNQTVRIVAAFISIFLVVLVLGGLANWLINYLLKRSGLNGTDRFLGMSFGLARGVFIVTLLILVVEMTSIPHQEYSRQSYLYSKFSPLVSLLYTHMPDFIKHMQLFESKNNLGY